MSTPDPSDENLFATQSKRKHSPTKVEAARTDHPAPVVSPPEEGLELGESSPRVAVTRKVASPQGAETKAVPAPKPCHEIFLPIHKFVYLTDEERNILDHPALQRLANVYQLGQTFYVYRGATHRRLEHVLGAVHCVSEITQNVKNNHTIASYKSTESSHSNWQLGEPLNNSEIAFTRLAALLHDVGHLPAGHTLEDELDLLDKHDRRKRIDFICQRTQWFGIQGVRTLREVIKEGYAKYVPDGSGLDPYELVLSVILKSDEAPIREEVAAGVIRMSACRDIVGNTICADLLDYLYRDWYHIGKQLPDETRLYHYMQMRSSLTKPSDGKSVDRFVIWVGEEHNIKSDAFSAILTFLERRYELAEAVLFHKTKCLATAMLERGLLELHQDIAGGGDDSRTALVAELLDQSDDSMLSYFQQKAAGNEALQKLFAHLRARRIFKSIFTHRYAQRGLGVESKIRRYYCEGGAESAKNRLLALRTLEKEFGLPSCSLAMYCPNKKMNAKLAQVQVCIDDEVIALSSLTEREGGVHGHLRAQIERFQHLWKVQVGIDRDVYASLSQEKLEHLSTTIERAVFGIGPAARITKDCYIVAQFLSTDDASPYFGKKPLQPVEGVIAARDGIPVVKQSYPSTYQALEAYYE
jgi:HD superfamily phosphohydrolase